jgi:hypothetical protein
MLSRLPNRPQTPEDDVPSSWCWPLQGRRTHSIPKRLHGKKNPSMQFWTKVESNGKSKLWTYLFPISVSVFKVGCPVKGRVRKILTSHCLKELLSITRPTYTALSSAVDRVSAIPFDSDFYLTGIDTHASCCLVNTPHLFKDLKLGDVGEVEGIKPG